MSDRRLFRFSDTFFRYSTPLSLRQGCTYPESETLQVWKRSPFRGMSWWTPGRSHSTEDSYGIEPLPG